MPNFTLASFNVKNLIRPDQEYYRFQSYTPEEYAWKTDWLSEQLQKLHADVVCFQEIFEEDALRDVISMADEDGLAGNEDHVPGRDKRYRRKAIFDKLKYEPYSDASLVVARNTSDGAPGERRPGLGILSRLGFVGEPKILQDLPEPIDIPLTGSMEGDGGHFRLSRLSRPLLRVRVPVGPHVITIFNCHLKSKLGDFLRPEGAEYAPEADLTNYDAVGRALGSLRSATRRLAEAWVLRREIVAELNAGHPVMVLGDFNDGEHSVSTEMITGEAPFKNYAWMQRFDAKSRSDRYTPEEDMQIREAMEARRLYSAERQFVRRSSRDMVFTATFGGSFESIDQIFMSRHFMKDAPDSIGEMDYFSVFNDHLADGSHPEAPYNKLASDHGQIMAHMRLND